MCPKPIYCSKVTKKGKTCSRVLEPQKVAPNAKGCWKVTEHNRDRPTVILKRIWFILTFWSFIKNQFVCWHRTWPCTEYQFRKLVFWANPLTIYQSRVTSRDCLKGWVHLIPVQKSFSYFISNAYVFIPRWKGEIKIWFFVQKVEFRISTCQSLMCYQFFTFYSERGLLSVSSFIQCCDVVILNFLTKWKPWYSTFKRLSIFPTAVESG